MSCKRANATPDWSVEFDDATAFKAVVDAAAAVLHRVTFKVVAVKIEGRECEWYVLKVDGADMGMTCCVSARLYIEATKVAAPDVGDIEFCIDCKHVQTALDSTACAHGTLSVEGHGDRLHIYVHDPTLTTQDEKSELKTFVDTETVTDVQALDFSTILEIDLSRLRELVKKARKWHSESVRIQIYLHNHGCKERSLTRFSFQGDADYEQNFFNETSKDEDGSRRVRACGDGEESWQLALLNNEPHFDNVFTIERIDSFIKTLPNLRMVEASLKQNMPILLTHNLCGGSGGVDTQSVIRFLIAPATDDVA